MPPQSRRIHAARKPRRPVLPLGLADAILSVAAARAALALRLFSAFAGGRGERTRPAALSDAGFRDPML